MGEVTAIPRLDLNRYLGRWYEIVRLPLKYEEDAATDITADYSLDNDGKIRVDNRCFDNNNRPKQALGQAEPVDATNAKLKVN
ncbi:hypothetical protein CN153_08015, partial [Sinorhizobium meliloti]